MNFLLPEGPVGKVWSVNNPSDIAQWLPSVGCKKSDTCYCKLHFRGSMDKTRNPEGIHKCMPGLGFYKKSSTSKTGWVKKSSELSENINPYEEIDCGKDPYWSKLIAGQNCSCMISKTPSGGCLFSDMRPLKLLAVMSIARSLGVTHIIEEGRYGGYSSFVYASHGFIVSSIEF